MKKGYNYDLGNIVVKYFCADLDSFSSISNCQDKYEIIYSISSLGSCNIEGNEYNLFPRSILIIPPLSFHSHYFGDEDILEGYSISFSRDALGEKIIPLLDKITSFGQNSGRFYSPSNISDAISDIFRRYDDAALLPSQEKKIFIEMLISEIIVFLSACDSKIISYEDDDLGARVVKYLNMNIEKNISLDRLATKFFVSKYHLCRAFKKYSGASVHSYINHKRIMYAKQLIESGETASNVAERVGFGDYSAFYRAYLKIVGRSPSKEENKGAEHGT